MVRSDRALMGWIVCCGRLLILLVVVAGHHPWVSGSGAISPPRPPDPGTVHLFLDAAQVAVAPDGTFLVFSARLPGGFGQEDLYVSFIQADGSWTLPRNLGPGVNSPTGERRPLLGTDGQALSFFRDNEIYWVDMRAVRRLRGFLSM